MKTLLTTIALLLAITLTGCASTAKEKYESYKEFGDMAFNPDCVGFTGGRTGHGNSATRRFKEYRCAGDDCDCDAVLEK